MEHHIRRFAGACLVVTLLSISSGQAVVIDGVDWTENWTGDVLPQASSDPSWTIFGNTPVLNSGSNATIMTAGAGAYLDPNTQWTSGTAGNGPDSTLEFRTRILTQPDTDPTAIWGTSILAGWNGQRFTIGLNAYGTDYVDFGGGGSSPSNWYYLDTTQYHTYRIVFQSATETASLYIDGVLRLTQVGSGGFANTVQFGAYTGEVSPTATSEWEYIRWTNSGAFVPVPEPSSFALAGVACAAWGFIRRHRRRTAAAA